ncbi:MAG TPA: hypothetical protein VEM58_07415 [Streptosporangiaceae bacterium]|nr:hypothetical protein [Streptosporangiaceae bacterium]
MCPVGPARPVLITTDLDRTLIFSPRATGQLGGALPADPVEHADGQTAGELCHAARDALAALPEFAWTCVATSRSVRRLGRLRLPFAVHYAIAANGGVVLAGGVPDPGWAARTALLLARAAPAAEVRCAFAALAGCAATGAGLAGASPAGTRPSGASWLERMGDEDDMCCLAIVDPARLGTEQFAAVAGRCVDLGWRASLVGRKLYAFPAGFGKEHAAAFVAGKVAERAGAAPLRLAAGDTEHDRPMLAGANLAWVPAGSELAAAWPDRGRAVTVTRRPGHAAAAQITREWLAVTGDQPGDLVRRRGRVEPRDTARAQVPSRKLGLTRGS